MPFKILQKVTNWYPRRFAKDGGTQRTPFLVNNTLDWGSFLPPSRGAFRRGGEVLGHVAPWHRRRPPTRSSPSMGKLLLGYCILNRTQYWRRNGPLRASYAFLACCILNKCQLNIDRRWCPKKANKKRSGGALLLLGDRWCPSDQIEQKNENKDSAEILVNSVKNAFWAFKMTNLSHFYRWRL